MIDFGHGIQLGPLDNSHFELTRKWRNTKAIFEWCRQRTVISDDEHGRWFDSQSKDPSIQMFIIKNKDEPVGVCGFTSIDPFNRRAEFSLYIDPAKHSCGYGTIALKTLFDHGFKDLGLNNIWGETFDGNKASKVFERIGMKQTGLNREFYFKNGKFIDAHIYSVLAKEWFT